MPDGSGFFGELKRRHVWRVAVAYVVAGWLIVQVATQVFPFFHVPEWAVRFVVVLLAIGFPVAMAFAWIYELTPEGIRRTAPADSPEARQEQAHHDVGRKLNTVIIAVLVLAVALMGWRLLVQRHAPGAPAEVAGSAGSPAGVQRNPGASSQAIPGKSIAVLPFENLSNDKSNAYFADGIQDLILTKLADIGSLKVISRTSTEKYQSRPDNLKQVALELGVATILEGSVQKQANEVLVNVQLIDARSDSHLWAHSYTRTLDNVFGVEGEVAGQIATALSAKLSPAQSAQLAAVPTTNHAAYDAFLRAEYSYNQGIANSDSAAIKTAIASYRQAVAGDPEFALAFARLSHAESMLAFNYGYAVADVAELAQQARADAEHALQLQPGLPAAQLALGYCDYWGKRDYAGALKAFAAVLAVRPNDADALAAQGYVQRRQGQFDAAIDSLTRVVALDPRNFQLTFELGATYTTQGRYAEAEPWYQRALALQPDSVNAKFQYANTILYQTGDIPRALAVVQGNEPGLKSARSNLLAYQRKFAEALALLQSIPDTPDNFGPGGKAWQRAWLNWQAGDRTTARPLFAKDLPLARARLSKVQGINQADGWNTVAMDEIGSGDIEAGLAAVAKSEAILAQSQDAVVVPYYMQSDAAAYAMAGRADLAVPLLAKTLSSPGIGASYSPVLLWLDPSWDPIRHDPRFQALLQKYAKYKPAVTYDTPPASQERAGA